MIKNWHYIFIFIVAGLAFASSWVHYARAERLKAIQRDSDVSFLVLDMDDEGITLQSLFGSNIFFDLDIDGFAERTGWVGDKEGILCIDANQNKLIDHAGEFFSNRMGYSNGFLALTSFDKNHDNLINSNDDVWEHLRVWIDKKWQGDSPDYDELYKLEDLLISEISLGYQPVRENKGGKNALYASAFRIGGKTHDIVETRFEIDNVNTKYDELYIFHPATFDLPTLRGYGVIPNLHIALSLNAHGQTDLLNLVEKLASVPFEDIFHPQSNVEFEFERILLRWASVDTIHSSSRGPHIDARKLAYLEKIGGRPFTQKGAFNAPNPLYYAAIALKQEWQKSFNKNFAAFLTQSSAARLFKGEPKYKISSASFDGITGLDHQTFSHLADKAKSFPNLEMKKILWKRVVLIIEYVIGIDNLSDIDRTKLQDFVTASIGSDLSVIRKEITTYQPDYGHGFYFITDRLYKSFGIRFHFSWLHN